MTEYFVQDIRYAVRQLRSKPAFTAAAILTLALGIGANLSVFLILYGVLLRPLPFPQSQQIIRVERFYSEFGLAPAYSGTKALFFERANHTLESVAAYDYIPSNVNLIQGSEAIPLRALRATSGFFHVLQMDPRLGRGFSPSDGLPNAPGVAVLSDEAWRVRFHADPAILGQAITLGAQRFTVIGVAGPDLHLDNKIDVWTPLLITEAPADRANQYNVIGRLKPQVTRQQAQDDLRRVFLQLKTTYPLLWNQQEGLRVIDFHDSLAGPVRQVLELLMGAVGLVLLIVSANILSLLLTRSIARRREMSLRAALGATGWRLLRQLLVENALLCIAGAALGIALAQLVTPALLHISPLALPDFTSLHIGGPALLFTLALTTLCALIFSLVPAFETRRTQINETLRQTSTQIAGGRSLPQKILVVSEVATSLVLLVAAALLLHSFWKLSHTSPGFSTTNVLTFKTAFSSDQTASTASFARLEDQLTTRLEAIPGVQSAAAVLDLPTQLVPDLPFDVMGRPANQQDSGGDEKYVPVTARYFDALQIPLLAGRTLSPSDTATSLPVIVVNQTFARTYFKRQSAVGQHIRIGAAMGPGFEDQVREIIGVVGDTSNAGLDQPAPGIMYLPNAQIPDSLTKMTTAFLGASWVIRTRSPQVSVAEAARKIFLDTARVPLLSVQPFADVISASVAQQRFSMLLTSAFGLISLILGAAGLYGVMSYTVARRTREIGIRLAIGAQRGEILRMVLREAGILVGLGLVAGVLLSLAVARLLESLLYSVASRDPYTLVAMSLVLLFTGLFSAWWPARRASRTEPIQALRME